MPVPRPTWRLLLAVLMVSGTIACNGQLPASMASNVATAPAKSESWTEATHGKATPPNYGVVYPADRVNTFQISIAPADWQAMLDNMTTLYGARGNGQPGGPGFGPPGMPMGSNPGAQPFPPAFGSDLPANPSDRPAGPGGPGGPGGRMGGGENPMWVAATITFDGKTWNKVGVRFKGNSSLMTAWRSGTDRIPFKLDFNQFADQYPEIKNQRFYGFRQMSLSTNMGDDSQMRDALAYDLLQASGLPAAETGFYEVFLDHGGGRQSLGVYTAVEVIDDTVVARAFHGDKGNIYEGDGPGVSLATGTFDQIPTSFQKENNKSSDWSDVQGLYTVLHDDRRKTDPAAWRLALEARFDVPSFLKWLALSAVMQHWDTYGGMTHNFYLYDDPATNRLTWISWDHNLILGANPGGGPGGPGGPGGRMAGPPPGLPSDGLAMPVGAPGGFPPPPGGGAMGGPGGGMGSVTLDRTNVGDNWPLIRFLLDDPTYEAAYVGELAATVNGPFKAANVQANVNRYAQVLSPTVSRLGNTTAFQAAVQSLNQTIQEREQAVRTFLAGQAP